MKIFKTLSLRIKDPTFKRQDSISNEIDKYFNNNEEFDVVGELIDIKPKLQKSESFRMSPYHPHSPARLGRGGSPAGRGGSPAGRGGKHPDYLRELGYYSDSGRQTPGNTPSVFSFPNLNELPEVNEPGSMFHASMYIPSETFNARGFIKRYNNSEIT